jgi:site-specific recombinase XerD
LLVFLRQTKQITEPVSKPWTNIENLVQEYDHHLDEVAGLAPATRHYRLRYAREFLQSRRGDLSAKILKSYFERRAQHLKPASQRVLAGSLRGLLRFLHVTGRSRQQLTQAIPTPAPWPRSTPPQVLSEGQYASLIKSFDRTTRTGKRDFAMALCLCLLGLRTQEVASLVLQDVDLCKSTIRLSRTKQRRERLLPLPPQLAKGLLDYVKRGRPTTHSQALFVRHRAPLGEALRVHHVRGAMRRAFARCGIDSGRIHLLRHTFATKLHRQGVGLKAIADLLGHACLNTTAGYARVDLDELRQAALPWPERNP